MKRHNSSFLFLFACVVLLLASVTSATDAADAEAAPPTPTKVFVCADSGEFSGAHELGFLHAAMEERETLKLTHCQTAYLGYLTHADGHRFRVLAVTTGIGFVSATVCTQSFLALQAERNLAFEAVILIGTSGFSPFIGGWDPTNTTAARKELAWKRSGGALPSRSTAQKEGPVRKFQSKEERTRDADKDLLRAVARGRGGDSATQTATPETGVTRVNGIAANINWERVVTEEQVAPDGCSPMASSPSAAPSGLKYNKRLSVGSICVTSASFLQESGSCTETLNSNQCSRPLCSNFANLLNAKNIHVARNPGSEQLVADILAASAGKPFPTPPDAVREGMRDFWQHNDAAAKRQVTVEGGKAEYEMLEDLTPSFVPCAESTMNAIFVGAERDYLCRERTAAVLNIQHRALHPESYVNGKYSPSGAASGAKTTEGGLSYSQEVVGEGPYSADNVVCVQAMEAFGFLESLSRFPNIPVAVVRTASNYDMYPQQKLYVSRKKVNTAPPLSAENGTDVADKTNPVLPYVWRQNVGYVSQEAYDTFVHASFHYSVATATFVVSNYFLGGRDLSDLKSTH